MNKIVLFLVLILFIIPFAFAFECTEADFDNDDDVDKHDAKSIQIILGRECSSQNCPQDINKNGVGDTGDWSAFLGCYQIT